MFESDATLILLAACGLVLLRPGDVPIVARYAGRFVGGGVRGLRGLRHATDAALKEGESVLGKHAAVGKDLRESLSKFDALRNTVSRDVARFAPFDRLKGGLRGALQPQRVQPSLHRRVDRNGADTKEGEGPSGLVSGKMRGLASVGRAEGGAKQQAAGVDFIARSIEEAALAKQQQRIFGGAVHNENQSEYASRPDPPSRG